MRAPQVTVRYVDGTSATFDAGVWCSQRADGVDAVTVRTVTGSTTFHGRSAYWLYREGAVWVCGAASFGYDREHPPEILFHPDGAMTSRRIEYVPDLTHGQIKLGWWWPGTTDSPVTGREVG